MAPVFWPLCLPPSCSASIATAFILYALEILDILPGAAIVVAIMLLTGCMSPDQARRAIRWVSAPACLGRLA